MFTYKRSSAMEIMKITSSLNIKFKVTRKIHRNEKLTMTKITVTPVGIPWSEGVPEATSNHIV